VGAPSAIRSARGGCWINTAPAMHASQRFSFDDTHVNNGIGFRCIRTNSP
jgi:formylglycine-generating enzyme required for sulfatase activity